MIEASVHAIGVDARWSQHLVLLKEVAGGGRVLPIWLATSDAEELERARQQLVAPRPGTHALIGEVLGAFGRSLERVRITELRESTFHAELELDGGTRVDSRASDALTLALRLDVRIEVADAVFDEGGVPGQDVVSVGDGQSEEGAQGEEVSAISEDDIERFRRLLDDARPEDFDQD